MQRLLRLGELLLSRGRAGEAAECVEEVLGDDPDHPGALCLQAKCLATQGNNAAAYAALALALASDPLHVDSHAACGALYRVCGDLEEAAVSYRRALACCRGGPNAAALAQQLAAVLTDKGTKLKASDRLVEAELSYREALAVCPGYAPAVYNRGVMAAEAGRDAEAMALYTEAILLQPRYAEALCNLGVLYKNAGDLERAIECYEQSLASAPGFSIVRSNLAIALTELGTKVKGQGNMDGAIRLYERALAVQPRHADALYNLGVAFGETRQLDKSVFMYEAALWLSPQCAEAWNNLGVLAKEMGHLERAEQCYAAALNTRPNFPQGLNNLAVIYTAQGRAREAFSLLQAAVMAAPEYAEAYNNLGVLQRDLGQIPQAISSYERCLELCANAGNAAQNRLLALNYVFPGELPAVCAAHEMWGAAIEAAIHTLPPSPHPAHTPLDTAATSQSHPRGPLDGPQNGSAATSGDALQRERTRPLRVGYITPDLFTHSVSYFAEAPVTRHRPAHVRTHVYASVQQPDAKTERLRAAAAAAGASWHDVSRMGDKETAELIRSHEVDILVELTGHTAHNRLGVMARRPAPVQATWIGYPNSTGLRRVDYRLTDAVADPHDTQQTFVERLVRLPGCFLCYTPATDAPPVAPLPALTNGYVTFGSFNALAKITPEVMRVWAHILGAVPKSRLLLKSKPFACEAARQHYQAVLREQGLDTRRVDLLPLAAANADHLATYGDMDISLDPWPYAGTTTTCESLFMGVPVITLRGRCHAHNVGASLLTAVGLSGSPNHGSSMGMSPKGDRAQPGSTPAAVASAADAATTNGDTSAAAAGTGLASCPPAAAAAGGAAGADGSVAAGEATGPAGQQRLCSVAKWVADDAEEYVAAAVAAASDLRALARLRAGLRPAMLASPLCDAQGFVVGLEEAYRSMWCAYLDGGAQ